MAKAKVVGVEPAIIDSGLTYSVGVAVKLDNGNEISFAPVRFDWDHDWDRYVRPKLEKEFNEAMRYIKKHEAGRVDASDMESYMDSFMEAVRDVYRTTGSEIHDKRLNRELLKRNPWKQGSNRRTAMNDKRLAGVSPDVWNKYERVKELMGADMLLDELMQAMSSQEAEENLNFIIQMHDLSSEFGEEEEEVELEEEELE